MPSASTLRIQIDAVDALDAESAAASGVTRSRFLLIEGKLQNQEGVIQVKAERIEPLLCTLNPR